MPDLFRKATSGSRPENAYLTSSKTVGASSISVSTTSGWATDTETDFVLFRKDSNNEVVDGTLTTWTGQVSGSTINNLALKAGTEPIGGYASGEQSVVIATPTAAWNSDLIEGITNQHLQTGAHGAITTTSIANAGNYSQSSGAFTVPNGSITAAALATNAITLGYTQITTSFPTTGTVTQVTGLSSTVTVPAGGRRLEITVWATGASNSVANTAQGISIWDGTVGSGTQLAESIVTSATINDADPVFVMACPTPAAGSKTYNVGFRNIGGGTATLSASATSPAFILIKVI